MARSGKTITFATDLLPQEDNTYNLGSDTDNLRWKIFGNLNTNYINQKAFIGTQEVAGGDHGASANPRYWPEIWNFDINITATDGDIITIKTPGAGSGNGTYLSTDNGAHYYPIVLNNTSRYTTHFATGIPITLRFDASGSAASMYALAGQNNTTTQPINGGVWRLLTVYDSGNNNDISAGYIRWVGSSQTIITTINALYRYKILLPIADTNNGWKVAPANTTNMTDLDTATQITGKTNIYSGEFNPFGQFLYYSSTATCNANTTVRTDRIWLAYGVDIRYSFNCNNSLTAGKDVYLVATLNGPTSATLRNPGATGSNATATATGANAGPITQTLPSTPDDYIYILLGKAYNSASISMMPEHPIYYRDASGIHKLSPINTIGTTKGDLMYWTAANKPTRLALGTSGNYLKATADGPTWASLPTLTNVSYTAASDNAEYPILMKNSTGSTTTAGGVKFNTGITINPSTNFIKATGIYVNSVNSSASSTLYLNSPASTSIIFTKGGASTSSEMARFDTDKNFVPKSTLTNTIGTSTINWTAVYSKKFIVESKAVLQWNSTDQSLDFIFV